MQPRRIARELALLSLSQLPSKPKKLEEQTPQTVMLTAIRALTGEVQDALEMASADLKRGNDLLRDSEFRAVDLKSSQAMVGDAIARTQTAINRLGSAVELPELMQLGDQQEVRDYTIQIVSTCNQYRQEVDELLEASLQDWQLTRLAKVDQNILRIAVVEMVYLALPDRVAINEAVELAKRYSAEEGHRFINGVLRRVTKQLPAAPQQS
ncbi:N utilization substance protein B [Acaryochloris thomasi RCC1774]|uniref:Transcription antitermination protein NusB n=1 Tax=Acaryochloris thomasi RCC1774 TaxID=1764569 RepID=A0A2W1JW53_9CYAN|nr:transcription antitermination factor NusB [Acaryochloris thomasi]PZD73914.1 N utilization substance protein B [Acaryochloris thomasi RCC1774]